MRALWIAAEVMLAIWGLSLAAFAVSYSRSIVAANPNGPGMLKLWWRWFSGWAMVLLWGPIAFLGMAWRRSPNEPRPDEWKD